MSRSLRYASPPDVLGAERPWGVAWSAAEGRDWFAHRLELHRPPDGVADLEAALARWDAEAHPPEVARRAVCWETPVDAPWPAVPERFAPSRQLGMVRPPGRAPPDRDPRVRFAEGPEVDRIAEAHAAEHPALGEPHRRDLRWLYRGLRARGAALLAAWDGARPIAAITVVPGPDEARLRELWTAADRRGEGLGTALIAAALAAGDGRPLIVACAEGSAAHRIYVRVGFRPASRFTTASTDRV